MIKKIISGGQTGADRAALDVAWKFGIPIGGCIPKGNKNEKNRLPDKYPLQEMPTESREACLEQNILDSDGTLIIARGRLTGGSDYTRKMTLKHKKQLLGINLNLTGHFDAASLAASWIKMQGVQALNVAGPMASEDRQIYSDVIIILEQVVRIFNDEQRKPEMVIQHSSIAPRTVEDAVLTLIDALSLKDKTTIAKMAEDELITLQFTLGSNIGNEFGIWSGNKALVRSCEKVSGENYMHPDSAPPVIIRELWKHLRESYRLRVVK